MIELTVCVPAFNAERNLERALRSIRVDEVRGSVEVLVCDDGSTDATPSLLARLGSDMPYLRVIRNAHNMGRPFTRNRLMDEARGRLLTWLDADDEKYPGMLSAQLDHLRRVELEAGTDGLIGLLVYTNYHLTRPDWSEPQLHTPEPPADPMRALLDSSFGGYLWLMMGHRVTWRTVGRFDERLPRLQDLEFLIRFAELGGRFARVASEEPLCVYHKDHVGRDALEVWRSWTRVWRRHRHHYVSYGMANARRWRRHQFRVSQRFALANGELAAFAVIVFLEVGFVVRSRLRRIVFDA